MKFIVPLVLSLFATLIAVGVARLMARYDAGSTSRSRQAPRDLQRSVLRRHPAGAPAVLPLLQEVGCYRRLTDDPHCRDDPVDRRLALPDNVLRASRRTERAGLADLAVWPGEHAVLDGLQGTIAPPSPAALGSPTLVMVAAGLASIAFVVAIAALWGIVVPSTWMQLAALIGAVSSTTLFLIYLSPLSIAPLLVNLVVLWGVFVADWTSQSLGES